jgi:ketosteroid isomerase-like protein
VVIQRRTSSGDRRRSCRVAEAHRREIRETIDAGDDVVVVVHETARLRDSGTALDRDLVEVWTLRDGLAVLFRVFPTKAAPLDAVGIGE